MAILTDENLTLYKQNLDELSARINSRTTYLADAKTLINDKTGSKFKSDYKKGKTAVNNITTIIDILQDLKLDLTVLLDDAEKFYETSQKAALE